MNIIPMDALWKIESFDDGINHWGQWWYLDAIPSIHLRVTERLVPRTVERFYAVDGLGAYGSVEEALHDMNRADLYELISDAYRNASDNGDAADINTMDVDTWTDDLRDKDADIGEYARHFVKEMVEVWRADRD